MTSQKIRELAQQLKTEALREKNGVTHIDLHSEIERHILDTVVSHADDILNLTKEVHEFTYNYYHPAIIKEFPDILKEGEV